MLRRIASYLNGYVNYAVASPVLVTLETLCQLSIPLFMAQIIAEGIEVENMTAVWKYGALMVVAAIVATITGGLAAKCAAYAAQGLGANLRQAEFEKITAFSFAQHTERGHDVPAHPHPGGDHAGGQRNPHPVHQPQADLGGGGHPAHHGGGPAASDEGVHAPV